MRDVTGKLALVTGGASGIGLGLSEVLLAAGMRVVVADVMQDHLTEAMYKLAPWRERLVTLQLDVTDRAAVAAAAQRIHAQHGAVQLLCPIAGVGTPRATDAAGYEDWDWVFGVNVGGLIHCLVNFLPTMKQCGSGHIVTMGSVTSLIPHESQGIYTGSKFAIRGISESLRLSLAPYGIGVTLVCPGLVRSRHLEAEKTRPAQFATDAPLPAPPPPEARAVVEAAAMNPMELAHMILQAVQTNRAYVLSHPEIKQEFESLCGTISAAFPDDVVVPPARAAFEAQMRRARELARQRAASNK